MTIRKDVVYETDLAGLEARANTSGLRVAWSGVWSGLLVAIGSLLLLSVLGLAIGISAVEIGPGEDGNAQELGIGAAVWGGLALLISLFIGGLVATRAAMVVDRAAGVIEGALIWVLSILALLYMTASGIGIVGSSVIGALGGVAQGAASAASDINVSELTDGDVSQITARLYDPQTVRLVAAATGMTQLEARETLSDLAQRVDAVRSDPARAVAEARTGIEELAAKTRTRFKRAAVQAQPYATATLWTTLIAMVLALLAAIGGAMTGRAQAARRLGEVPIPDRSRR